MVVLLVPASFTAGGHHIIGGHTMNENAIRAYMRDALTEHIEQATGEPNCTTLAEDACQHFDAYHDADVPECLFEWAFQIAYGEETS